VEPMTVYCSYCSAGYLLPDHLMGPRGARVRCPRCGKTFVVLRDPAAGDDATATEPAARGGAAAGGESAIVTAHAVAPVAAPAGSDAHAERLASELLDAIAAAGGDRLLAARQRGRVLAEFGADLMRAYDEYRSRLGTGAPALAFKRALRDRWAVDLITGVES